jgi:hypothetical protein
MCDTCDLDIYIEVHTMDEIRNLVLPKGWIWKDDTGFCHVCKRYSGVTVG